LRGNLVYKDPPISTGNLTRETLKTQRWIHLRVSGEQR
jgi:hypothetical protein